ncbi:MAG: hypothetical protein WCL43_05535 [Chlorobium sp.]|jgi:hypothetical protein|nr:MAG: hypothetical protein FDX12_06350 [Chlorobium sp.]
MHAKIIFTSNFEDESLIIILKGNQWWPTFEQESAEAERIVSEMKESVKESDIPLFLASKKFVLISAVTETRGTLSHENNFWVLRLLNQNLSLLQLDCQVFVHRCIKHANQIQKQINFFDTPVQLVERNRKDPIIEGKILASKKDRFFYARKQKKVEYTIGVVGFFIFIILLFITYPWPFRDHSNQTQMWLFTIFEKLIGSVAVTSLISFAQFHSFYASLHEDSIKWSIAGEPEKKAIKTLI